MPSPGDLPNPGIEARSPSFQVGSLPAEPQGKAKNTRVGSLSLLQGISPTQESNWGLLHCRRILYQLSYKGSQKSDNCSCFLLLLKRERKCLTFAAYFLHLETPSLPACYPLIPPFLLGELCCQGKGASFSFRNCFLS